MPMLLTTLAAKERLATGLAIAAIGLIAAVILSTYKAVNTANLQREKVAAIAQELFTLRLLTFEYRLYQVERIRVQWIKVSDRVDAAITAAQRVLPSQTDAFNVMRAGNAKVLQDFVEFASKIGDPGERIALDEAQAQLAAQLLSPMLAEHQKMYDDAGRLIAITTQRISGAQQQMLLTTLTGLVLIAVIVLSASWFARRRVLAPIAQIQQAAQQITAGNWNARLDIHRHDELGELAQLFNAMTTALQTSFAKLERSNRDLAVVNQELETFSYSVSHDLRAPLRSTDGFARVLLEDYGGKLDDDGKDALQRICAASQRMGYLIDDLLRLSQVTRAELTLKRVDLSAMAVEIADALAREEPSRHVSWEIERELSVFADRALLRIALQNLLQNAWKFTGKSQQPVIRVGKLEHAAMTEYFVADNGAGFDSAHATKLFGAFQRMHNTSEFPGTGIGLTIVQRIVHRHGGTIRAEAKVGQGATFLFTLKDTPHGSGEQDHTAG